MIRQIRWYLSPTHRDDIDCGCPIAGFAGEIPHLSKAAQVSYDEGLEHIFNQIAQLVLEHDSTLTREEAHGRAISLYSHMVGSVLLSRAASASQPALADQILKQVRSSILADLSQPSANESSRERCGLPEPKEVSASERRQSLRISPHEAEAAPEKRPS